MSEKIKSKNLHKKIFLIKITYINNRFNETGFCGEWIDRISHTEINTQIIFFTIHIPLFYYAIKILF